MLRDVTQPSKAFLVVDPRQVSATLLWVAGLFLFSLIIGLSVYFEKAPQIDWLRRYSLQLFLLLALFHLYFILNWRPLFSISARSLLFSLIAFAGYFGVLKAVDVLLEMKFGVVIASRRTFESLDQTLLSILVAPVLEELFFRDALLRSLYSQRAKLVRAIFFSSFFFMIAHMSFYFGALLLGIASALLVYASGSIIPSIIFHSLSNLSWYFLPAYFPSLFKALTTHGMVDMFYR